MNILKITLPVLLFTIGLRAQTVPEPESVSVEKSMINVQTGLLGVWGSYEARLSNTLALRTEAGFDVGFYYSVLTDEAVFMGGPSINIEPRWYYNIKKRAAKGRNVTNNAANFVGLSVKYLPDWFTISSDDREYNIADQVLIVPKWSIRRNIGNSNFNYETGVGLGVQYAFLKQYGYRENTAEAYLDLHVRIGYTF